MCSLQGVKSKGKIDPHTYELLLLQKILEQNIYEFMYSKGTEKIYMKMNNLLVTLHFHCIVFLPRFILKKKKLLEQMRLSIFFPFAENLESICVL